jgi:hypothetical protein
MLIPSMSSAPNEMFYFKRYIHTQKLFSTSILSFTINFIYLITFYWVSHFKYLSQVMILVTAVHKFRVVSFRTLSSCFISKTNIKIFKIHISENIHGHPVSSALHKST